MGHETCSERPTKRFVHQLIDWELVEQRVSILPRNRKGVRDGDAD